MTSAAVRWAAGCVSAAAIVVGCATAPQPPPAPTPACDRVETIQLELVPTAQLNPDREGYSRSVVVRVYQLQSAEAFATIGFEELWQQQTGAPAPGLAVVSGPDEFTLIPGRIETKALRRHPTATHVAVAAKFREYHPDSGWRVWAVLPTPKDPCQDPAGPRVAVELLNYSLRLR